MTNTPSDELREKLPRYFNEWGNPSGYFFKDINTNVITQAAWCAYRDATHHSASTITRLETSLKIRTACYESANQRADTFAAEITRLEQEIQRLRGQIEKVAQAGFWGIGYVGRANYAEREREAIINLREAVDIALSAPTTSDTKGESYAQHKN